MFLHGIAIKPVKKGPMRPVESGIITSRGLDGNYYTALRNIARSKRQVCVTSLEQWHEVMELLHADIPWFMRRANLCVSGYAFGPSDVGKTITVGEQVTLEITGETDPCRRMEEILPGLKAALAPSWRGGATCRVLTGGSIAVGDMVTIQ